MSDPETRAVYDRKAADYAALTGKENRADPHLAAFIAACPRGGRVLDLGCGPGAAAALMAAAGLAADAIDASAEMVALASAHPGVNVRQASFDDVSGTALYDGIWANFSLLHAPCSDFPRHLAAIRQALKPGGLFHIGLKLGAGEGRDALGRFYTYYTENELERHLAEAGFGIESRSTGRGKGLSGEMADFITVSARA